MENNPPLEQTIPTEDPIQATQSPIQNQKSKYLMILGVFALLLIVGGGAYYFGTQKANLQVAPNTNQQANSLPSQISTPIPSKSPEGDETKGWRIVTGVMSKYSFKYPPEWSLVNVAPSQGCDVCVEQIDFTHQYGDDNIAVILIMKEDRIKSLDDYVNILVTSDPSKVNLKYTTVGSEKAVSYTLSDGLPPLPIIEYAVVKNGMYYIIRLDNGSEANKNRDNNLMLFNEMLSTFTFNK